MTMTFYEWWDSLTIREQNNLDKEGAMAAWEFGQLEAAEHILEMYKTKPWVFAGRLVEYVESLK